MQFHPAASPPPPPTSRPELPLPRPGGGEGRVAAVTLMVATAPGDPRRRSEPIRVHLSAGRAGALAVHDRSAPATAAPSGSPTAPPGGPTLPVGRTVFSIDAGGDRVDHLALIPIGGAPSSIMRLALRAGERDPIDPKPDVSTQGTVETTAVDLEAGPYLLLCRIGGHLPSATTAQTARAA